MNRTSVAWEISIAAVLIALYSVLRIVLAPLMGGNPTFVLIILTAAFLSRRVALMSGVGFFVVTGFFMGFGIWVASQIVAISLIVLMASILPKKKLYFCIFGVFSSFFYSFIMLSSALPYVALEAMPAYIVTGLPSDIARAVTNLVYVLVLYQDRFISLITKHKLNP